MAEHEAKEWDKDLAWLLQSIRSTCHRIDETKHLRVILLENRTHLYNHKQGQYQEILDCAEELQAMWRAYDAADIYLGPSINTGLKDTIVKSYEKHEEIKINNSANKSDMQNGAMTKRKASSSF